jgi:hypothetical protein
MACGMNGGASGGPWMKDRISVDLGYVFAVTSRCATKTPNVCALTDLYATPNGAAVRTLFNGL